MNEEIICLLERERDNFLQKGKHDLVKSLEKSIESVKDLKEPIDSIKKVRSLPIGLIQAAKVERLITRREDSFSFVETMNQNLKSMQQSKLNLKSIKKGKKQVEEKVSSKTSSQAEQSTRPRQKTRYIPKFRSAAYSLLLGLYQAIVVQGLEDIDKQGLINLSQPFCDSILQRNGFVSSQSYSEQVSGWTSMSKILLKRQLARTVPGRRPLRYTLTEEGKELANILINKFSVHFLCKETPCEDNESIELGKVDLYREVVEWGQPSKCIISYESTKLYSVNDTQTSVVSECQKAQLYVVLDNREVKGFGKSRKRLMEFLEILGVPVMLYQLELGDILFVAMADSIDADKCNNTKLSMSEGRVLDYLIERKRNDDLASSLHDRRFSRQRFCMKQSNISHLIYLIEGDLKAQEKENVDSLWRVLMSTAMVDNFHIEYSKDVWESACFVKNLYQVVNSEVQKLAWRDIMGNPSLEQWNRALREAKKPSGLDLFKWQLMSIPGIDYRRAQDVVSCGFRSLVELGEGLDRYSTRNERISYLQEISLQCGKKRWCRNLYETIEALFCCNEIYPE
ncbi:crossover junction endonuclease MUS81 isoform 1 [Galdieria sulphuraria]|uniref:Crossover junction endonuclease MUS81 n=1 Tax=Galdieria sulphuraria TaxID=130081 RepID=M2XL77_GALSU|nr:crossover junction endonuclease MUS81 isoform 1 [Galdieria sulphuraria]EME30902.1 crossover junction endonuclease MUS81 isoform 1 [Galdieria sulphuraria]|eukprot:XP_005707422.1 crossover junction endonuclease MUS81 isoform 1 [Galdieria sulphuraria]